MTQITVTNEIFINLGNTGSYVLESQAQSFTIDFATPSGVYVPAGSFDYSNSSTSVFYVSGTVVEGGDIVTLTPDGDIPPEFNGKTLVTDAVVITPEIFLSAEDLADPTDPPAPPAPNPPLSDGKVADATNVILLLHADTSSWFDSSSYTRTMSEVNSPAFDPLRKAFGTGSLFLPADGSDDLLNTVITDEDLFALEDDSFTFEARIRLDSVAAKTHTLFSFGDDNSSYFDLQLVLDPATSDKIVVNWRRPPLAGETTSSSLEQIELPVASGKFLEKPNEFQQFAFVYDKIQGHFAAWVDGERIGFVDASAFTSPAWNGLNIWPLGASVNGDLAIGSLIPLGANNANQFEGHLDEVRLTLREALYQSVSLSAAVYPFPWPNPIT